MGGRGGRGGGGGERELGKPIYLTLVAEVRVGGRGGRGGEGGGGGERERVGKAYLPYTSS